jgi:hypothetical protein
MLGLLQPALKRMTLTRSLSVIRYPQDHIVFLLFWPSTNSTKEHASLWYRVAPIEGAANVIADWVCSGGDYGAAAYSYTGVHQTTPFGTPNSNTGNSGTASVIVDSATGELVIDGMLYNFNDATPLPVKDGTQTQRVLAEIPELDADTTWVRSGASEKAGAASVTMSWTASSGNEWAIVGAALKPVATCPGGSVCWDGGGSTNNWSEGANWTGNAVPSSTADVVFNGLSTKDATFNVADTIGSLTLASGYTDTLTLSATLTNDGPFIMNSGTLNMGSATVNQNDDWTYTAGTVDAGTSNVILASSDLSVNSGSMAFNDVTLSLGGGNSLTVTGTMDVDGDLTINSIDGIAGTVAVSGNVTTVDTTVTQSSDGKILIDGSGAQTLSASGGAGGLPAIEINNTGTLTIQDTIHMDDNWVFTGGTVDAGTSTVVFDGSDTSVTTGTMAFNNVTVNFSGANTLTLTDTLDIDGDLTLTNAGDGFGGAGGIEVAGNLTSTWVNCCGSNAITLDGANAQTVDIATGDITKGLFTINKTNRYCDTDLSYEFVRFRPGPHHHPGCSRHRGL